VAKQICTGEHALLGTIVQEARLIHAPAHCPYWPAYHSSPRWLGTTVPK
jgi:hypothetical protein